MTNIRMVMAAGLIIAFCGDSAEYRALGWTVATVCGSILLAMLLASFVFGIEVE